MSVRVLRSSKSESEHDAVLKPRALNARTMFALFAPASPGSDDRVAAGFAELESLQWHVLPAAPQVPEGYFANSLPSRRNEFLEALGTSPDTALLAIRGGYGSNYLLDDLRLPAGTLPRILVGYSDLTSLQIFLWQRHGWVTFYGPMLASGFHAGAGAPHGYDQASLFAALRTTNGGWSVALQGETLASGSADGRLLGGCLTLVETTLGTPWELDTRNAILVLEDRGMKPWQVDRALMHLAQAGKFAHVKGVVLGDFPECEAPVAGSPTVRDVVQRILGPLRVPMVFGAPVGHTERAILTLPLGVKARLIAEGQGTIEILEPAVVP
jgi:muramoyltetrapeptide carboxypeptidase